MMVGLFDAAAARVRHKPIYTIVPGSPFLPTFVAALLDGRIVEGFTRALGPLEIADATIYVPTRRSALALAEELCAALGQETVLLPKILPLGALEETEVGLFLEDSSLAGADLPAPEAIREVSRRLQLAELVLEWSRALRHAIISVDAQGRREVDEREACLVGTTAADAWRLSSRLAGLIDELIIEDIAWTKLDRLVLPEFDAYWGITLSFLDIVMTHWPRILAELGRVDAARRQVALVEAQSRRLRDGHFPGPVIAIGSTGSNKATAHLLAAIAAAPRGAVVLPGLDLGLDAASFAAIAGDDERGKEACFTHPQAMLCRLLPMLGVTREDVVALGAPAPALAARGRFLSEALRPAETTDAWLDFSSRLAPADLVAALEGVTFVEALDEREEALALALALRESLETRGATAALVTPDRNLARRVRAELLRWGIEIEDSAGEPLSASPHGTLARLVTACATPGGTAQDLAALLTHPLARLGLSRAELSRRAALLEIGVLRGRSIAGQAMDAVLARPEASIAAARVEAAAGFAHPAKRRLTDADWIDAEDLLRRLSEALAPLAGLAGEHALAAWIGAHRKACVRVFDAQEPLGEAGMALEHLLGELEASATRSFVLDAEAYGHFFAAVAREVAIGATSRHPRLKILGLLEARLLRADVILLGGLDETIWPPRAETDAFLNRPMRAVLGLTPPERRLGQTAHDFVMALGHERVVLSRARKRDGAPTVASRFIQRMAALGGDAFGACALRGERLLRLARQIDLPAVVAPLERPMPRPPVELRPTGLSVTRVETLRRDPYAIYAELVLRLVPLEPLGVPPGNAELGTAVHAALEVLARKYPAGPLPDEARAELRALLARGLATHLEDPDFASVQWPRLQRMIDFYLGFEAARRQEITEIATEVAGKLDLTLVDGSQFRLSARADRVERHADGTIVLVDFKTGAVPTPKEIKVGFAPQLTLEAAMVARDGFGLGWKPQAIEGLYVKLGGKDGGKQTKVEWKDKILAAVAEAHLAELVALLDQYRDAATPYPPRPFPKFAKKYNAYDHLARVAEWSLGGAADGDGE
jgi:ATP-dependent helicase/nuclease subunit B